MKILVVDTETTGLPTSRNASIYNTHDWPYVIQLSFILYDTDVGEIIDKFDSLIAINECVEISPDAYNIHHISKNMCYEYGTDIKNALRSLNQQIAKCDIVVGHNISFDKQILIVEFIRNDITSNFPTKSMFCTMKRYKTLCNIKRQRLPKNTDDPNASPQEYIKFPTLSELHNVLFMYNPKNLHNSYVDILICLRCYMRIEYNTDILSDSYTFFHEYNTAVNPTSLEYCSIYCNLSQMSTYEN